MAMAADVITLRSRIILQGAKMDNRGKGRAPAGRLRNLARKSPALFFEPMQQAVDEAAAISTRTTFLHSLDQNQYIPDTEGVEDSQTIEVNPGLEAFALSPFDGNQMPPIDCEQSDSSDGESWPFLQSVGDPEQLCLESADTQLPETIDLGCDSEDEMAPEPASEQVQLKGSSGGRQLVHKDHVALLVKVYQKALGDFTRNRKGVKSTQLIPSKVWRSVYAVYRAKYPDSKFKEDSLKEHLRQSIKDLSSQNPDTNLGGESQEPGHDEELLERLMATDSWKARNILQTRMDAMHSMKSGTGKRKSLEAGGKVTPVTSSSGCEQTSTVAPTAPVRSGGNSVSNKVYRPPTKSQNLKEAREDVASILGQFTRMSEDRRAETNRKRSASESKAALHEAKRLESEERKNNLASQNMTITSQAKMAQITLLKEQRTLGLLTESEFTSKCRDVFNS